MEFELMNIKHAFGIAFKMVRQFKGLTLLAFAEVSGRTYIREIEKGLKSPTIEKVDILGRYLDIHPITISYLAYLNTDESESFESLSKRVKSEVIKIQSFNKS